MKTSAVACLGRGTTSLLANWELVPLNLAGWLLAAVLLLAGLLVPFVVLGSDLVTPGLTMTAQELGRLATELLARIAAHPPAFLVALVGTAALWLAAGVLACYLQAGTYGVLVAAERQSLPGPRRDPRWFRTFSLRDFLGWGGRYLWRFVGFGLLYLLVLALLAALALAWLGVTFGLGESQGALAGAGVGCGGALPLGFLLLTFVLWSWLAEADLAREGSGVFSASRRAARVLGRRLGGMLLLAALFLVASLAIGGVFGLLSLAVGLLLDGVTVFEVVSRLAIELLSWVVSTVVALSFGAALVALLRAETGDLHRA